MYPKTAPVLGLSILLWLPLCGNGAVATTRQQTVRPLAVPPDTRQIAPRDAALYKLYGYSAWQAGPGEDQSLLVIGQRLVCVACGGVAAGQREDRSDRVSPRDVVKEGQSRISVAFEVRQRRDGAGRGRRDDQAKSD